MGGESRVAWREGQFLRPQHFQQQDRYTDALIRGQILPQFSYPWGLSEISIDQGLAAVGKFGIEKARGILPDATPFSIPGDFPPPPPIDIPADTRDAIVYLTLPARQLGATEFAHRPDIQVAIRSVVELEPIYDGFSSKRQSEEIETAKLNLNLGVTSDQTDGRITLGLGMIREVLNGQVAFDERYIAPSLAIRASTRLMSFLSDIQGRADQSARELAMRAVDTTEGGAETFVPFLMLQALNRWIPVLQHYRALPVIHPERLFETFCSMAGELCTFTRQDRRPPSLPDYVHDNPNACFAPVVELLQQVLTVSISTSAGQLPLESVGPGSYVSRITDRSLFDTCSFFLAVSARVPAESLRQGFASVVKIGSTQRMLEIVSSQLQAGVRISPALSPPPQLRILPGYVYFELDRHAGDWTDIAQHAPALGLHVAGDWPDLKMQLWWVKRSK